MSVFVDTNVLLRSIEVSDPSHDRAVHAIAALMKAGEPLVITPQIAAEFWNVATRPLQRARGVEAHDARLVAAMKVYGITKILTFDIDDFVRYPEVEVVNPATIVA